MYDNDMANEIVKFSNQFNNQALRRFTALDLDMLLTIAHRMRDKKTDKVTLTFDELRQLAHIKKNLSNEQLKEELLQVNRRLLALNFEFEDGSTTIQFALFQTFKTDAKTATLEARVNSDFTFLLNDLTSNFTRFELSEFVDLKSSYAKEFFRRAKQYRSTGVWAVSLEDFRRLLDVPESYTTADMNKRVIKTIEEELGSRINLKVERKYQKKSSGRGRSSLVGFVFHFQFTEHHAAPAKNALGQTISKAKASERERSKIARAWFDEHVNELGSVGLADVAQYARTHTEISVEDLPSTFAIRFLP